MDAYGRRVRLQLREGNITAEDTQAIVRFIYPNDEDPNGLLRSAGDDIRLSYCGEKDGVDGRIGPQKGVVTTSAGDLPFEVMFRVEVRDDQSVAKFRTDLFAVLRAADKLDIRSISFPGLISPLCSERYIAAFVEVIYDFENCENPLCLHFIRTVIPKQETRRMEKYSELIKERLKSSSFYLTPCKAI